MYYFRDLFFFVDAIYDRIHLNHSVANIYTRFLEYVMLHVDIILILILLFN